jgi:hypothetical protein
MSRELLTRQCMLRQEAEVAVAPQPAPKHVQ